jgi:large subunit ribosomal protein L7e
VDPTMQKAFKYLGLGKVNTAVFVKANPTMDKILSNLKDYLCWGSPDIGMIQSFIQKRGYAVINQQLTPLTDNKMIEDQLGKHNIVCIEDIVHEITTVGPAFSIITKKWLAPFKVPTPKGGWVLQIGNGNKASHIDVDEYGVPIEHKIKHNGLHQPEEFKKIVTPMI